MCSFGALASTAAGIFKLLTWLAWFPESTLEIETSLEAVQRGDL